MTHLLVTEGDGTPETLLLAHGAGGAMDSAAMNEAAAVIASRGIRVVRFEFGYMAGRRDGVRRPPPRAETLMGEYRDVVAQVAADGPV
ncbi:MAG: alpha/beta family hydrolase, partial [Rhodoglobus sp.]